MARDVDAVFEAIDRWERGALIDADVATRLRREAETAAEESTRRLSQYALAGTAGAVLLIAGGAFLSWSWPLLGEGARVTVLGLVGVGLLVLGARMERGRRWLPVAYLLQTAALGLLLGAATYSKRAWDDLTPGGLIAGVLALAVPVVLAPRAIRRSPVMPAVHLAFALAFLAVFLDRATPLSDDAIVWILDAVLLAALLVLLRLLREDVDEDGAPRPWVLNAFVTAISAGFVLIWLTGVGPLGLDEGTVLPLDLWLLVAVVLTVRGIGSDELGPCRAWLGRLLGWQVALWIPLGFYTALEWLDGPPELVVAMVGGGAVAAFLYGNRHQLRSVITASALAFVAPLWYWGVERGGALGAVFALALTAGVLFWLSGRSGVPDG